MKLVTSFLSSTSIKATKEENQREKEAEEQAILVGAAMGKGLQSVCEVNDTKLKIK